MGYDFVFDTIAEMIDCNEEWDKEDKWRYLDEVAQYVESMKKEVLEDDDKKAF